MFKRFFITGTDTSVGKTVVSRALLQALAARGKAWPGISLWRRAAKRRRTVLRNKDALVLQSVSTLALPYEAVNPIALSEDESSVAHSCPINSTVCCPMVCSVWPRRSNTWWLKAPAAGAA
ncbi:AAA family ATPase [Klebsiella pneumoniae subsp. pneumoniae]|nr:AAA family ATPase [Klebsiella pneumoniae subsp. pneumoniae]